MKGQDKEDILTLIKAYYKIPGEYFIASLVLFYIWKETNNWNKFSWILLLFSLIFFILEFVILFTAGGRLANKLIGIFEKR